MANNLMDTYEIPEDHKRMLLTICHKTEQDELPEKVRKRYIYFRWHADVANHTITPADLVHIVANSNWIAKIPDTVPDDICTGYLKGNVQEGQKVTCKWRHEDAKPGVFLGVNPERLAIVRFEGEPDERALSPDRVTVA